MKLNKRNLPGIAAGLAILALGGFVLAKTLTPKAPPPLVTAVATMGQVENAVLATGMLQPAEVVNVGVEVSGRIVKLNVAQGDLLRRGDVIAQIDPMRLMNDIAQAENQIKQSESTLQDRLAQLEFARTSMERQKLLYEQGAASKVQYEQQNANYLSRIAQTDNQREQIENQRIVLDQRKLELSKATVKSPIDAIVAEVVSHQGDTLSIFRDSPVIVRLANISTMIVRAQVSEADIHKVQPGQKVYFTILGQPEKRRYAVVKSTEISPAGVSLDPSLTVGPAQAVYYNVTFETPNEDELLMPSMTAEVHVVLGETLNVLTVPVAAITRLPGRGAVVQVLEASGNIAQREVTVGISNSFRAEIRSGLKVGERVVLPDPVRPANVAAASTTQGKAPSKTK